MNTVFEVIIAGESESTAGGSAGEAFREVDRLERMMNRFDAGSDVGQISLLKPGKSAHVSSEVFECLLLAAWAHAETGGAFDVTVGALMDVMRRAGGMSVEPGRADIEAAVGRVGMKNLKLSADDFSVSLRGDERVGVDLGAIAKGYALDKAADILESWGIRNYLLNAGTSTVLAGGDGDETGGWHVGVGGDWGKAAGIEGIRLHDESLSGSGTEIQGEHILDPRTGRPAKEHLAAWARCPSAAASDALSTAFMVMSTGKVREFCATHEGVSAFVVENDGLVVEVGRK